MILITSLNFRGFQRNNYISSVERLIRVFCHLLYVCYVEADGSMNKACSAVEGEHYCLFSHAECVL